MCFHFFCLMWNLMVKLMTTVYLKITRLSNCSSVSFLCFLLHSFKLHDCVLSEEDAGKNRGHGFASKRWKEADLVLVYRMVQYAGKRKRGKNNTHLSLCKIRRNEASASVWCGLDKLVAAAAHPLNSRLLFESAAIEFAVIERLKLHKSSKFWSSHQWINQQMYF